MSTNDKNKVRPGFLLNFTENTLSRIIVVADTYSKQDDINYRIGLLNEDFNLMVHKLNIITKDRNIPYIKAKAFFSKSDVEQLERDTRIIIDNYPPVDEIYDKRIRQSLKIPREEISHVVDILIAPYHQSFTVSSLSCDARLILDYSYFNDAIIDILLDISMFNSYSFLKDFDIARRKEFSRQKFEFCKNKSSEFYEIDTGDQQYFSLAFLARDKDRNFNIEKYVDLWAEFLNSYYPEYKHINQSVQEQLLKHTDFSQLPKNCAQKIMNQGSGTYLLLRTNTDRTDKIHPQLYALFGTDKAHYRTGLIKIVPIEQYDTVFPLLENLDVSAFKVIV